MRVNWHFNNVQPPQRQIPPAHLGVRVELVVDARLKQGKHSGIGPRILNIRGMVVEFLYRGFDP